MTREEYSRGPPRWMKASLLVMLWLAAGASNHLMATIGGVVLSMVGVKMFCDAIWALLVPERKLFEQNRPLFVVVGVIGIDFMVVAVCVLRYL